MRVRRELFEVWFSRADGLHPGPKFGAADDAEAYLIEHFDQAPFAIRDPDGQWRVVGAPPPAPSIRSRDLG